MKTLVTKNASETDAGDEHNYGQITSLYIIPDDMAVNLSKACVELGVDISGNPQLIIGTPKTAHLTLHSDVTEIKSDGIEYLKGTTHKVSDWLGHRFTYDGTNWGNNSGWVAHSWGCTETIGCDGVMTYPEFICSICESVSSRG